MKVIWYNPDQQTYKCGSQEEMILEKSQSQNQTAYTILMEFKGTSNHLADQVLKQLNFLNQNTEAPVLL